MDANTPGAASAGSLPPDLEARLARLAVLQEPLRRALYLYVATQPGDVGRDEAAEAVGIGRSLAAFHLDKLAEAGLLDVGYRRLTGRSGPGAGRPAKLYRRSSEAHQVSLPPRDYELAAHLLAMAVEDAGEGSAREAVERVARRFGESVGHEARQRLGSRPSRRRQLVSTEGVLARYGFEPYREGGEVRLRNCPFHTLAHDHPTLACGMNLALIEGLLDGVGGTALAARPDPRPGECCVTLGPSATTADRQRA